MKMSLHNRWIMKASGTKHQPKRIFFFLMLCLFSPVQYASDLPLFEADYTLKRGNFTIGMMHRSLHKENGTYIFESSAKPKGFFSLFTSHKIREKSQWQYENGQIISQKFTYQSGSKKKLKRSNILFNTNKLTAQGMDRGRSWQLALPTEQPIYDRANYQIALMQDLRNNNPVLHYLFIKRGKLKDYRFIRRGKETIKTPLGALTTIKVQRQKDKRATTIWLAPTLNYLPVKIEQIDDDGTHYLLSLKKFKATSIERTQP